MTKPNNTIYCQYTGLPLGTVILADRPLQSCASLVWQSEWKQMIAEHPMFGLTTTHCLRTARILIRDLINDDSGERDTAQEEAARVAFVAVMRNMGVIARRDGRHGLHAPILPKRATVITHGQQLLALAYWYAAAQSPKFKFPLLNVTRLNANTELQDIGAFLSVCQTNKNAWLEDKRAQLHRDVLADSTDSKYLAQAARTEAAVIGASAKRMPKTALWNWLLAAIESEDRNYYEHFTSASNEDGAQFYKPMFFASDGGIKRYQADDIDALEDILLRYAPLGTVAFSTFRRELNRLRDIVNKSIKSFTIDWNNLAVTDAGTQAAVRRTTPEGALIATTFDIAGEELAAQPEPQRQQFDDNVSYIRAHARWRLAQTKQQVTGEIVRRSQII